MIFSDFDQFFNLKSVSPDLHSIGFWCTCSTAFLFSRGQHTFLKWRHLRCQSWKGKKCKHSIVSMAENSNFELRNTWKKERLNGAIKCSIKFNHPGNLSILPSIRAHWKKQLFFVFIKWGFNYFSIVGKQTYIVCITYTLFSLLFYEHTIKIQFEERNYSKSLNFLTKLRKCIERFSMASLPVLRHNLPRTRIIIIQCNSYYLFRSCSRKELLIMRMWTASDADKWHLICLCWDLHSIQTILNWTHHR